MAGAGDRYVRATTSSNLKLDERKVGDADVLIAAGWTKENLATLLYRLQAEFSRIDKKSVGRGKSEAILAFICIPSYYQTRLALVQFVAKLLCKKNITLPYNKIERVVDRVLDNFLDATCKTCNGVRFTLIPGTSRLSDAVCGDCCGTGVRPLFDRTFSKSERMLVGQLLDHVASKTYRFDGLVGRFLTNKGFP